MVAESWSMCFSWSKISCMVRDRWDLKLVWAELVSAMRCWNALRIPIEDLFSTSLIHDTAPVGVDPVLLYVCVLRVKHIINSSPQPLGPGPRSWNCKRKESWVIHEMRAQRYLERPASCFVRNVTRSQGCWELCQSSRCRHGDWFPLRWKVEIRVLVHELPRVVVESPCGVVYVEGWVFVVEVKL